VLLHEVVHLAVFPVRRPRAERALGLLYAIPSGISASQFTRWHLDHHAELGSSIDDPKRHHLSPKINARWIKLLYCSPALFPIYFRAARRESSTYPPELQKRIAMERKLSIGFHLSVLALVPFYQRHKIPWPTTARCFAAGCSTTKRRIRTGISPSGSAPRGRWQFDVWARATIVQNLPLRTHVNLRFEPTSRTYVNPCGEHTCGTPVRNPCGTLRFDGFSVDRRSKFAAPQRA
jgi:hypothetical protein